MHDFNLEQSLEYQKIKETRKIITNAAENSQGFSNPVFAAVSQIINRPDREFEILNDLSTAKEDTPAARESLNKELSDINKKKEIFSLLLRPDLISPALNDFNLRLSKNIYLIYAISNYSFADYIFRYECETDDLKRFRSGANEDPQATLVRNVRRKAEEAYKNNKFDEAINFFNEANSKYQADFTIYYQLGLIYFFEKADFKKAMENFRLASKYSHNKYNLIFIHSMVFTGLLLRLYAVNKKNVDMLNEAYQAIYQAYAADTGYTFSKYALAQCCASMGFRSDLVIQTGSLIKNLIMSEKLFCMQIIFDTAFNTYIDELEKIFKNIYNDILGNITNLFEKIDIAIEQISINQQYLTIPSKVSYIKNEHKKITEQLINKKTLLDIESFFNKATFLFNELEELSKEIDKNKKYSETRAIVEAAVKNFKEDYNELTHHYIEVENKFNSLKEQYIKLNSYYPNPEFDELMASLLNNDEFLNNPEKKLWRESGIFVLIKIISGGLTFVFLILIVIILSTLFTKSIASFFGIAGVLLSIVFMPIYSTIFGEVYYNIIEIKRRNIISELKKIKYEIDVNKIKINEIENKVSAKYIALISEQTHLTTFTSEKMFEACKEGNFEQIKALIS